MKWKTYMGNAGTSPTIGQDGTIYCGYKKLYAINPTNGSVKWMFDVGGTIQGATPCHSSEDIIFFGTHIGDFGGGEIIAVNSDGKERWRKMIANKCVDSAPAIGEDGTVYIGSCSSDGPSFGYLHAYGIGPLKADANGPYYGLINQPIQFKGSASGGYSPYTSWHWDFGDTHTSDEQNPTYTYTSAGNYSVTLTVTDNTSNTSSDTTFAWIQTSNSPPILEFIDGPTHGTIGISYNYTFKVIDPEGASVWFIIDWGDSSNTGWIGPIDSGKQVTFSHTWYKQGIYIIKGRAKDPYDDEGPYGELKVKMPKDKDIHFNSFKLLERFPILQEVLSRLIIR